MTKRFYVTGTFGCEVEADSIEEAEEKAAQAQIDNPDTDYKVEEVTDEPSELVITINRASDGEGYMFDIYEQTGDVIIGNPITGGLCTSTLENAVEMAGEEAKAWVRKSMREAKK